MKNYLVINGKRVDLTDEQIEKLGYVDCIGYMACAGEISSNRR